jgi:hypothetical protein
MASGIIEYLAEGAWTKRHASGWAAQSGLRAALLGAPASSARARCSRCTHGLFHGFANTREGDY